MAEPSPSSPNPFLDNQPVSAQENLAPISGAEPDSFASQVTQVSGEENPLPVPHSTSEKPLWWKRPGMKQGAIALALVLLIGAGVFWWFARTAEQTPPEASAEIPAVATAPVTTAPPTLALPEADANYESENFKAGEIVIGGELQFLMEEGETGPLLVENIRGEAFLEKNKKEVKLVVTWTTSRLTQASVRYSKGIGQAERAVTEDDYSYNHSIIISGLDPASTYVYIIDAYDRYGNQVKSEPHAVFTGARTVSLFDLIAGAIGEVFGWAISGE